MDHSITLDNTNIKGPKIFVGYDGQFYLADRLGTHRATAVAIALLQRPNHRAIGERESCNNA